MYCVILERDLGKKSCVITLFKDQKEALEQAEVEALEQEEALNVYVCDLIPRSRSYRTVSVDTEAL